MGDPLYYRKITVCTGSDDYLASREPATVHSPRRVFVYLCSRFKILFFSNRLNKNQEHFDGTKQALQGKKENHVTPLSSKSLCEHFNKTIYSSHLVPIWRSSQKLRKNPTDFLPQPSKCSSYSHPKKRRKQRE